MSEIKYQEITPKGKRFSSPMQAIKANCLDCSAGVQSEVRECRVTACALFAYRSGKNPFNKGISEEARKARSERFKGRVISKKTKTVEVAS